MNHYNPQIHHRRSIRLKGYDYSQEGLYFITICCQDRICRFGDIQQLQGFSPTMILNEFGQIAYDEWAKLPERFPNMKLDVFQIMPNHMHGILALVGATLAVAQNDGAVAQNNTVAHDDDTVAPDDDTVAHDDADVWVGWAGASPAPTVFDIVGAYKSLVANGCLKIFKTKNEIMGKLWQRNYWEHIIRDEQSYLRISEYIINNPAKWDADKLFPKK